MMGAMEAVNEKTKQVRVGVKRKEKWPGSYWSLWLERGGLEYRAGQYVSIRVNEEGGRRSYSLASYPGEEELQLVVDTAPMGVGSRYVLDLEVGDEVEVLGPMGEFVVSDGHLRQDTKGFLMVGTGSGVVPLRPMINDLLKIKREVRPVRLYWGMRHEEDLFWMKEWMDLEKEYENFKIDVVLSRGGDNWKGCNGHVGDCLKNHGEHLNGWQAYVCGSREMVEETSKLLMSLGVGESEVNFEKFF